MAEMQRRTLAMPADERMIHCVRSNSRNRQHSSIERLSWYFAQRGMPGLVYVATMNGYVAYGPDKGGK